MSKDTGLPTLRTLLFGTEKHEKIQMASLALVLGLSYAASGVLVGQAVTALPEQAPTVLLIGFILLAGVNLLVNGQVIYRVVARFETGIMTVRLHIQAQLCQLDHARFETIGAERIWLNMTSGIQAIFDATALLGRLILNIVGAIGCLAMLAHISFEAFLLVALVLIFVSFIFILNTLNIPEIHRQARNRENQFLHGVTHQIVGMKELKLNQEKYNSFFHQNIINSLQSLHSARTKEHITFFNSYILFVLLLLICASMILYVLPLWIPELSDIAVKAAILAGILPVSVFRDLPVLMRARAALKNLSDLSRDLDQAVAETTADNAPAAHPLPSKETPWTGTGVHLRVEKLGFYYRDALGEALFCLGPLDMDFAPGKLHFLTGGNGSGKSTLVRLLTGLCPPSAGDILVNGHACSQQTLRDLVTPVFATPHLFDALYGQRAIEAEKVRAWLTRLELSSHVSFENGKLIYHKLSSGQAKRLALIVAVLEDRPLLVLDEWAAEQDPEHREWYYRTFLPEMRRAGKTTLIVTHDKDYFDAADILYRFENGQIMS